METEQDLVNNRSLKGKVFCRVTGDDALVSVTFFNDLSLSRQKEQHQVAYPTEPLSLFVTRPDNVSANVSVDMSSKRSEKKNL